MKSRPGIQAARPGPARSCSPPATRGQQDERPDHDGHSEDDRETGLDAYVARLVDAAPPLSSQQRDTLALLLRRPRRRLTPGQPGSWHRGRDILAGIGVPVRLLFTRYLRLRRACLAQGSAQRGSRRRLPCRPAAGVADAAASRREISRARSRGQQRPDVRADRRLGRAGADGGRADHQMPVRGSGGRRSTASWNSSRRVSAVSGVTVLLQTCVTGWSMKFRSPGLRNSPWCSPWVRP